MLGYHIYMGHEVAPEVEEAHSGSIYARFDMTQRARLWCGSMLRVDPHLGRRNRPTSRLYWPRKLGCTHCGMLVGLASISCKQSPLFHAVSHGAR